MEKVLLSLLSASLGFILSQSFNFVSYVRRPKFRVRDWGNGVSSLYTGDVSDTPWEIEFGFYLENYGRNPAKNTRVFVSNLAASLEPNKEPELTSIDMIELRRPLDFIPRGECVLIRLGTIRGNDAELTLDACGTLPEDQLSLIGAETRGKVRFSARFYVSCDDKNSFKSLELAFRPDRNEWAASLLEDYTPEFLDAVSKPKLD